MAPDKPSYPVIPTEWEGYLPTFQTSLAWLMQHTTPAAEEQQCQRQREHAGGGSLAPTVPPVTAGARLVTQAFDIADIAAQQHYLRSQRRFGFVLSELEPLIKRLAESGTPDYRYGAQILRALSHNADGNQSKDDGDRIAPVIAHLNRMRTWSPQEQCNYLRATLLSAYIDDDSIGDDDSLLSLLQKDGPEPSPQMMSKLASIYRCIEINAESYR